MEEDDDLWAQIYGEAAPPEDSKPASAQPLALPPPEDAETGPPGGQPPNGAVSQPVEDASAQAAGPDGEPEEDDELDIQLEEPDALAQDGSEDDEFEVTLDDGTEAGSAGQDGQLPGSSGGAAPNRYVRPGAQPLQSAPAAAPLVGTGYRAPFQAPGMPARPPPGTVVVPEEQPSLAPGLAIEPAAPRPAAGNAAAKPQGLPAVWPHTSNSYSAGPGGRGEGEPVLPSLAAPGQRVRLPGQTRVMLDEYKEFLGLGHGDIFSLDPDLVVDAPWRHPGADASAFFNYGHTMRSWREYCCRVEQYRLQFTLQKKIQTVDNSSRGDPAIDPDLPPELRAALAAERREQQQQQQHSFAPMQQQPRPYGSFAGGPRPQRALPLARPPLSDAVVLSGTSKEGKRPISNGVPQPPSLDDGRNLQQATSSGGAGGAAAAAPVGGAGVLLPAKKQGPGLVVKLARPEGSGNGGAAAQPISQPQENGNGSASAGAAQPSGPKPPLGRPPPRPPPGVPPPRPPPRPPPSAAGAGRGSGFAERPGMMGAMGGPMGGPMGAPVAMNGMGMPGMMGHMGMGMGMAPPMMMGGPMHPGMMHPAMMGIGGGHLGGGHPGMMMGMAPPMPPMMLGMDADAHMGANGWGRMRRDSNLAELGITEEEFQEYSAATAKRPRRAADNASGDLAGGASLAMGMDVEQPAAAKPGQQRPLPGGSSFVELAGYRGHRRDAGSSDEDDTPHGRSRHKERNGCSGRERSSRHRSSRSRSRERHHGRDRDKEPSKRSSSSRHQDTMDGRRRRP